MASLILAVYLVACLVVYAQMARSAAEMNELWAQTHPSPTAEVVELFPAHEQRRAA